MTGTHPIHRTETRRVPRTTGALSGLLVIVLGVWGGLIPFIGPYFHYAFGSYRTWHYTSERLWLCIVPGAVAVIGGLMLLRSSHRSTGLLGGWLAVAAGAWFAIGPSISLLWHSAGDPIGAPMGAHTRQAIEWLGYFSGLGVAIAALAAFAMGRYFSRPRVIEEAPIAAEDAVAAHDARVADREGPVAATAADEPLAEREVPMGEHEAPTTAMAADEPSAAREPEPLAPHEPEPIADREEPVAPANEPASSANEPVAPRDEPTATGQDAAASPQDATGAPTAVTYRRRSGLSRFRR